MSARVGERCFRMNNGGEPERRTNRDFCRSRFPSQLYSLPFFPPAPSRRCDSTPCTCALARACFFFSFPDENVMSEVEIAGRGTARRVEGANGIVLRNEAININ